MKKILSLMLILIMAFSLAACGSKGSGDGGKVKINVILVLEDGTEVPYEIEVTNGTNFRDALLEGGLITEETYGELYITTIDKYVADWNGDPARTWQLQDENRKPIEAFFEEVTIEGGATYYLENILVPYFDD